MIFIPIQTFYEVKLENLRGKAREITTLVEIVYRNGPVWFLLPR